jgi:hypothetical protein
VSRKQEDLKAKHQSIRERSSINSKQAKAFDQKAEYMKVIEELEQKFEELLTSKDTNAAPKFLDHYY